MSLPKLRILIADDDSDTRKILSMYLSHVGHKVMVVDNGRDALEMAARHPPDVALVDVVMPGLSGLELVSRLREVAPGVQVILFTAYATIPHAIEAVQQGAFSYLEKPLEPRQVLAAVEAAWAARKKGERQTPRGVTGEA